MKLSKKTVLLALLMVLCASLLCLCALIGRIFDKDETPEPPAHVHKWGAWITEFAASCDAGGQENRFCDCGEHETRTLDATGAHLLGSDNACVYCRDQLQPSEGLVFEALTSTTCQLLSVGSATGTVIVIPYTYEGMTVTQIGIEALKDQTAVKNIILPNGVKIIEESAFNGCMALTSIAIPTATVTISAHAFSSCFNLSSINFGTGSKLKTIGKMAFYCTNLSTVDFGDNSALRTIGDSAFFSCIKLSTIRFGENSVLSTIGPYSFTGCTSLTFITLPEKVRTIKTFAFYDCPNLTSIILPKSLDSIAERAFYLCDSFTSIYYCGSVNDWDRISISKDVGRYFNDATIYYYAETEPAPGNFKYWHYAPTLW